MAAPTSIEDPNWHRGHKLNRVRMEAGRQKREKSDRSKNQEWRYGKIGSGSAIPSSLNRKAARPPVKASLWLANKLGLDGARPRHWATLGRREWQIVKSTDLYTCCFFVNRKTQNLLLTLPALSWKP
jgi:hypothetical protein